MHFDRAEEKPASKHQFLRRKTTSNKSGGPEKLEPLAQNNGLKRFNKGMTFKGKGAPRLSKKGSSHVPPGGHSTLNLFSVDDTALPDPAYLARKHNSHNTQHTGVNQN
jgi:hypothetical protein